MNGNTMTWRTMLGTLATLLMRLCLTYWIVDTSVQCLLGMYIRFCFDTYSHRFYLIYLKHVVLLGFFNRENLGQTFLFIFKFVFGGGVLSRVKKGGMI